MTDSDSMFELRATTEADRTYVARLNYLTDVFGDETAETSSYFDSDSRYYLEQWEPENNGFIAWDGYIPAGGVWLRHGTEDNHGWGHVAEGIPELAIAVEPRYQGKGLGGTLLDAAAELARTHGATSISLSVNFANPRARELYARRGFELVDSGEHYHRMLRKL